MAAKTIEIDGRTYTLSAAPCSLCGGDPPRDEGWSVVRASLLDTDGVYFSYLCYHESRGGCLEGVLDEQPDVDPTLKERLDVFLEMYGDDEDAVWADMTSIGGALE